MCGSREPGPSWARRRGADSGSIRSRLLALCAAAPGCLWENADQTVCLPEANEIYQMQVTLGLGRHLLFWGPRLSPNLGRNLPLQRTLERLAENSLQWLRPGMLFKVPQDTAECRINWGWGWRAVGSALGVSFLMPERQWSGIWGQTA